MSMKDTPYRGVIVPMITPLNKDQTVDAVAARKLVNDVVSYSASPFVLGSTGEGYSLSLDQKQTMVRSTVEAVEGRALVYSGISSNSLSTALEEAKLFASLGANVLVATLPFYYPVDEQQIVTYFKELADQLPLPLIIYNMPGMVKRSIPLGIVDELSLHDNIVGLKDSERDIDRMKEAISRWKKRSDFAYLIGWAAVSVIGLHYGADGIVPSTGNLCPRWYADLLKAVHEDDISYANKLQDRTNLVSAMYQNDRDLSHSIPALKCMLSLRGKCQPFVAPPLYRMNETEEQEYLRITEIKMKEMGL